MIEEPCRRLLQDSQPKDLAAQSRAFSSSSDEEPSRQLKEDVERQNSGSKVWLIHNAGRLCSWVQGTRLETGASSEFVGLAYLPSSMLAIDKISGVL